MKSPIGYITGAQLTALSREKISDSVLEGALKEKTFRDFARILVMFSLMQPASNEPSTFGHSFIVRDVKTGEFFDVDFDIRCTAKKAVTA